MKKTSQIDRLFILGGVVIFLVCCGQGKRQSLMFLENAKGLGEIIAAQAAAGTNLCNMYNTVWEYAKVTGLDFRSAYKEMMLDTSEIANQMESNKQMMDKMMNLVKSPPKNMAAIYDKLIELREYCLDFNKFVIQMPQIPQAKFNSEIGVSVAKINSLKNELDRMIADAQEKL